MKMMSSFCFLQQNCERFRTQFLIYLVYIFSQFFENKPNESCSHLKDKAGKGRLFGPGKLQNHTNDGKRKSEKEERRRREKNNGRLLS